MRPNKALQLTRRRPEVCQGSQPAGGRSGGRFAGRPPGVPFSFTGGAQLSAGPLGGAMRRVLLRFGTIGIVLLALAIFLELRSPYETLPAELFLLAFGEDTRFSPSYSDSSFSRVAIGDSEAAVRRLLGDGVWEYPAEPGVPKSAIHYSDSPSSTHFRRRVVSFSGGVVDEIIAGLYVD